jgi:hypothetical protein
MNNSKITERDIEYCLWESPWQCKSSYGIIYKWIARQYRVPSGIIDLLGVTEWGNLAVFEIKNVPIDSKALAQVSRYALDIENILEIFCDNEDYRPKVGRVVVGELPKERKLYYEAESMHILLYTFDKLTGSIDGNWILNQSWMDLQTQYIELSTDIIWDEIKDKYYRSVNFQKE